MSLTLSEARDLTPGDIVHFGDENTLYEVKLVATGWNMPVHVDVERYPEAIEGLATFFTEAQLELVTYVGKGKHEAPTHEEPQSPATPSGDPPVDASHDVDSVDASSTGEPESDPDAQTEREVTPRRKYKRG